MVVQRRARPPCRLPLHILPPALPLHPPSLILPLPQPPEITKQDRIVCDWRTIGFPSMCPSALTTYEIKVFTGHAKGAGTDAGVRIMLFGELGYSGPWELTNRWRDLFERGRIDEFYIEAICIGCAPLHSDRLLARVY